MREGSCVARHANVVQFPGTGNYSSKAQKGKNHWDSLSIKFWASLALALTRRFVTFWVLVIATIGNTLFAIATGIGHFIFRAMAVLGLVLGLGYAFFAWFFVVVGKAHADPQIWQYLGNFEINMLVLFMAGVALDLALTSGKGWLYAQCEKIRPLIFWGLK